MGQTLAIDTVSIATCANPRRADFRQLPAYVEPPAPRRGRAADANLLPSATALIGLCTVTILCFGLAFRGPSNARPAPAPQVAVAEFVRPPQPAPAMLDVPLPRMVQPTLVATASHPAAGAAAALHKRHQRRG